MANAASATSALIDHHMKMVGTLVVNAANCDLVLYCVRFPGNFVFQG